MLTNEESERLGRCSVLVVEDELLIALHIASEIKKIGCSVVHVSTLAHAFGALATHTFTAAVLDVQLSDGFVFPLALELEQRGIPVAFVSGKPKWIVAQHGFDHRPFLTKPVDMDALERTVVQLAFE